MVLPYIRIDSEEMKGGGASIWKKLKALSGVPVTLYSLRHFFAEQNLSAGVPLHVVSRWAGHSKVELTSKTYGDYAPDNAAQWDWANPARALTSVSPLGHAWADDGQRRADRIDDRLATGGGDRRLAGSVEPELAPARSPTRRRDRSGR